MIHYRNLLKTILLLFVSEATLAGIFYKFNLPLNHAAYFITAALVSALVGLVTGIFLRWHIAAPKTLQYKK